MAATESAPWLPISAAVVASLSLGLWLGISIWLLFLLLLLLVAVLAACAMIAFYRQQQASRARRVVLTTNRHPATTETQGVYQRPETLPVPRATSIAQRGPSWAQGSAAQDVSLLAAAPAGHSPHRNGLRNRR